jgi:hypothetical protein
MKVYPDKVVQMIPAPGWRAIFGSKDLTGATVLTSRPLVCWVLFDSGPDPQVMEQVVGMVVNIDEVVEPEAVGTLVAYLAPGGSLEVCCQFAELVFADEEPTFACIRQTLGLDGVGVE